MAPRKNSKKAEEAEVAEDQAMEVEEQEEQPEGEEAAAEEAEDMQEEGAAEEGEEEEAEADAEEETAGQLAPAEEEAEEPSTEQVVETEAAASAIAEKEVAKPRLMIREIVLENFKSYGGRKIIGPFHKSFSSIVGPNGSGKSNTIDALLFVFGKRAKKMRLNKVSELIHQSGAMPNLASAKVEVTFQDIRDTGDGPEDYEILEGTTLTVSREAFKNNSSKYYLDGKLSNFGDVTTLLKTRGVDLEHNRFLILQGEVEQISLMKPKALTPHEDGLLEYLEDIIGSNRFLEPIEQSEAVVEKLTEQRQEKLNRLRVAEREKESLDGPRKEAEAWVTAEAERLELQSLLAQAEAKKSQANHAGLEEEHKALQTHMEGHRLKMEGFEKEVKAIEGEHNTHLSDYNKIKEKMEKSALDFKEFERLDVKFTEDIAFHEQKLQKLSQTAQREREQAVQLVKDAEQLKVDAPTREQELDSAERFRTSQATKLEQLFAGLKGKAERLRPAKEAKEKELVPLQQKLTEVKKVVEVAQTEAGFLRQKTVEVADQIEQLKREHTECSQRLSVRELEGKDATKMRKDRVKLVGDAKQRLGQVTAQMEEVTQEAQATRVKAEEARSEFEQEHFRGRLIKAVYEQSKAGRLKGVYGRLGDLGTINKKYDVAVSTACSMLDAIVVETTEDAQAVIEFIRSQDLGRTTCICMQKIQEKARHMDSFDNAPESASRLLDLIKPEKPEYRVAFFFALGNTLVAKDMDQATRIGLQGKTRHRVVTLAGGLIDTSGTMSGGGGKVASGGMRASICRYSPEEVKGLVAAYEQANAKLVSIRQERQALDEALTLTEKEISDIELREQKCTMEVSALTKQMEAYDARLKVLKVPQLSGDEKSKLKQLEKLIESRSDELNTIMQEHQAVEEEVRKLHDQIMNIGGDELKQAKAKLEESTKKCEDMRRNIKKALLDADNMVKNSKKAEASAKVAVDEHKTCEKALETLRKEHAKLDDKAEQVLNAYNKLKDTLAEKDEVLTALRGKRDEVIQKASSLKSQEVDLVNEMEVKTRTLRELYGRITAWSNKLQEARKEYAQLPLDLLAELRGENKAQGFKWQELARKAMAADLELEVLEQVVRADIDARMLTLEANVKNLKPNLTSIEEFRRADGEHRTRLEDYETVHGQREDARRNLEQLRQSRLEEFMEAFSIISMKLKEMYQMITLGGDAELELVDTLDPFSEGIAFSVRPPKKSWKQITNLSGGEKTLASLSLVFALHHFKPTPLYFMDEIDAALDFRNVSIIANYIKERTKNAQFIVISLRNHMFEMADLLVGIYKTDDISKSVGINPSAFSTQPSLDLKDSSGVNENGKRPLVPIEGPSGTDAKQRRTAVQALGA
mmetsp:Transcript_70921/g.114355  ORF Transcript_70921/g.114355 Transcript_70921/m.114355 type:complete len:1372 (-) Transcript_70921:196-4311(-)|eukprot:CAMPEP_0115077492 /NCGR_PEP_ID=MMETSP0227-20121206/17021_1 /TAXON_ID=89957 /ORGANISM="Polarella glacialis, Strain CCMP 1383" /LENGTH=1371 /DNA_ID=CAMNT_0002464767 /DNA_START=109 /DNA_END=4224 /DNA_ORIENTATION=-